MNTQTLTPTEQQELDLIDQISKFAQLKFDPNCITIEYSDSSSEEKYIESLPEIREIKDMIGRIRKKNEELKKAEKDTNGFEKEWKYLEKDLYKKLTSIIVDPLGIYVSWKKSVVVFVKKCETTAERLNCSATDLVLKVLAHELSHAISHLGEDKAGKIWDNFDYATTEDVELFAQLYPYKILAPALVDILEKLADTQSPPYRAYELHKRKTSDEIYDLLIGIRKKKGGLRMSGVEGYPPPVIVPKNPRTKWCKLKDVADIRTITPDKMTPNNTTIIQKGIVVGRVWATATSGIIAMYYGTDFFEKNPPGYLRQTRNLHSIYYFVVSNKWIVDPDYLFEILNSPMYRTEFAETATGYTMPVIKKIDLEDLLIPVPPMQDQETIVAEINKYENQAHQALQNREDVFTTHL